MSRIVRRLCVVLAGTAVVLSGFLVAAEPASARPYCDGPNPPPICEADPPAPTPRHPDLVAASSGPASAVGGTTVSYVITVSNATGTNAAAAQSVTTKVGVSPATVTAVTGTNGFSCAASGGGVTCTGGALTVGAVATITVRATLPAAATIVTATATVDPGNVITERNEGNNTASTSTAVTAPALPDLAMAMTGPSTVRGIYAAGTWTMTITNQGSVPADVRVQWLTNWGGDVNANAVRSGSITTSCFVPPEYAQQLITCYGTSALQPGASATIVITAVPPAPGNVFGTYGQSVVTATVDYGAVVTESNESNNVATVVSTITP